MRYPARVLVAFGIVATVVTACAGPPTAGTPAGGGPAAPDPAMALHHLHGLMAHGFEMSLEGAALKMLGEMQMTGAVDASAISHGNAMLSEGRALVDRALDGPAMATLHSADSGSTAMTYTHDLGKAIAAVLDRLQAMRAVNPKDTSDMELHHMHLSLAHAAVMATQAATLKMTAAMKMAGAVDDEAAAHAGAMAAHARALFDETIKGEAMTAAHKAGSVGEGMKGTHDLGDAVNAVMELLAKMP